MADINADLLLASGAVEGPFRRTHPLRRRPAVRFLRRLAAWLLAPSPWIHNRRNSL